MLAEQSNEINPSSSSDSSTSNDQEERVDKAVVLLETVRSEFEQKLKELEVTKRLLKKAEAVAKKQKGKRDAAAKQARLAVANAKANNVNANNGVCRLQKKYEKVSEPLKKQVELSLEKQGIFIEFQLNDSMTDLDVGDDLGEEATMEEMGEEPTMEELTQSKMQLFKILEKHNQKKTRKVPPTAKKAGAPADEEIFESLGAEFMKDFKDKTFRSPNVSQQEKQTIRNAKKSLCDDTKGYCSFPDQSNIESLEWLQMDKQWAIEMGNRMKSDYELLVEEYSAKSLLPIDAKPSLEKFYTKWANVGLLLINFGKPLEEHSSWEDIDFRVWHVLYKKDWPKEAKTKKRMDQMRSLGGKFCNNLKHVLPDQADDWLIDFVEVAILLWGTKFQNIHGDYPKEGLEEVVTRREFDKKRWYGSLIYHFVDPGTELNHAPQLLIERPEEIVLDDDGNLAGFQGKKKG